MISVTTYGEAREAFRSRDLRQALYDDGHRLMTGVIVNLHGSRHVARRRVENRLFRGDTFAFYEHQRIPEIADELLVEARSCGCGDLARLARRTMLRLSADLAGVDLTPDRFEEFEGLMQRLAKASTVAHALGDLSAIVADGDDALACFERHFFVPSRARRTELLRRVFEQEISTSELPRDVLTTLLRNQDHLELSDDELLREVAYFPWVGSHSSAAQLVHAMHHIFEWLAEHPHDRSRLIDDKALLQRYVHESMRLHPASPVALRVPITEVELASGRLLAAGDVVSISVEHANRDASVFGGDADAFVPHRSLPAGVAPWGLSFGHGMHACLGREIAGGTLPGELDGAHLAGAVAVLARTLLLAGAHPDPHDPPTHDTTTTRVVWGRYPANFAVVTSG